MSAKRKPKVQAPQTWAEANALLEEYGEKSNALVKISADLDAAVAKARKPFDDIATPIQERLDAIFEGLQLYADANRKTLTEDGKYKTVKMANGSFGWRTCPASVEFKRGLKAADIVENILEKIKELWGHGRGVAADRTKARAMQAFIRRKMEPNKDAMLADQDLASEVPGVKIVTDAEIFFVDPTQAELAEAKS